MSTSFSLTAWQKFLITKGYEIVADGIDGPKTQEATKHYQAQLGVPMSGKPDDTTVAQAEKFGLNAVLHRPQIKIAIDPGHGMGNRKGGLYDPGAVGNKLEEATVVLHYAKLLVAECVKRGWKTWLTRQNEKESAPVGNRASRARAEGCNVFVSLHCNAAATAQATGTETLYLDDLKLAQLVQRNIVKSLGLVDRGVKRRDDLAVLNFNGPAVLIEFGFISNAADVARFTNSAVQVATVKAIADAVQEFML